jgi:hypothetical protein
MTAITKQNLVQPIYANYAVTCDRSVVFSTNKTDRHDITEILLKVVLQANKPIMQIRYILILFPPQKREMTYYNLLSVHFQNYV